MYSVFKKWILATNFFLLTVRLATTHKFPYNQTALSKGNKQNPQDTEKPRDSR